MTLCILYYQIYRPSFLRLVVCRRKTKYRSELIPWEPSFKCTSTGSVVWPHPFQCTIAITPPSIKDSATGTLRHKDITISLQNVEKHSVSKIFIHPGWNKTAYFDTRGNDLAILELENPITEWTDSVQPACLPVLAQLSDYMEATVMGSEARLCLVWPIVHMITKLPQTVRRA